MANEQSSNSAGAVPGSGFDFKAMFDAMEFARRSWSSSFSMPEALTPTVDPQELDKRIADLRTVEHWLVLNLNLLRGSIQTLELQRAAIDSIHSFGNAARAAAEAARPASSRPEPAAAAEGGGESGHCAATEATRPHQGTQSHDSTASAAPPGAGGFDPAAWWQTLQQQFQQVAESALAGSTAAMAAASKAGPAAQAASPRSASARRTKTAAQHSAPGRAKQSAKAAQARARPKPRSSPG